MGTVPSITMGTVPSVRFMLQRYNFFPKQQVFRPAKSYILTLLHRVG